MNNQEPSNAVLLEKINNLTLLVVELHKSKANKWVEKGAVMILSAVILYLVGGLIGLFKINSISVAYNNILTIIG